MGEHLRELDAVEAEARRSVEQVTRTLANTAAVFGPLVGGATVALAGAMGSAGPLASGGTVDGLGLVVVGAYVLVLAAILTALSTGLSRGFDRALVGYRVGLALPGRHGDVPGRVRRHRPHRLIVVVVTFTGVGRHWPRRTPIDSLPFVYRARPHAVRPDAGTGLQTTTMKV